MGKIYDYCLQSYVVSRIMFSSLSIGLFPWWFLRILIFTGDLQAKSSIRSTGGKKQWKQRIFGDSGALWTIHGECQTLHWTRLPRVLTPMQQLFSKHHTGWWPEVQYWVLPKITSEVAMLISMLHTTISKPDHHLRHPQRPLLILSESRNSMPWNFTWQLMLFSGKISRLWNLNYAPVSQVLGSALMRWSPSPLCQFPIKEGGV